MHLYLLLAAFCALVNSNCLVQAKCAPNICALAGACLPGVNSNKVECLAQGQPGHYEFVPKGGFCGCCDACVRVLGQGEFCSLTHPENNPAHDYCGMGLICNEQTLRCYRPFGPLGK